ncbi:MAG: hypothetical protein V1816_14460 [Pseudomonadota bacterium]
MPRDRRNEITDDEVELLLESLDWFSDLSEEKKASLREVFYTLIWKIQKMDARMAKIEDRLTSLDQHMSAIFTLISEKKELH